MKYLILSCLIIFSTATSFAATMHGVDPLERRNNFTTKIFDKKVKEISYCIVSPEKGFQKLITDDEIALHATTALREWTHGMALRIKKAGKEKEYKDAVSLLDRNIKFTKMENCDLRPHTDFAKYYPEYKNGATQADITFIFSEKYCKGHYGQLAPFFYYTDTMNSFVCFMPGPINMLHYSSEQSVLPASFTKKDKADTKNLKSLFEEISKGSYGQEQQDKLWRINRKFFYDTDPTYFAVIAHELGHAFSLTDQYTTFFEDVVYSSSYKGNGLMAKAYESIGCDEINGILAAIYIGTDKSFTSFCDSKTKFKGAVEVTDTEKPVRVTKMDKETTVSFLLPDSPKTLLYREETFVDEGLASFEVISALRKQGFDTNEVSSWTMYSSVSTGLMKAGKIKVGVWEQKIKLDDKYYIITTTYDDKGTVIKIEKSAIKEEAFKQKAASFKQIDLRPIQKKEIF